GLVAAAESRGNVRKHDETCASVFELSKERDRVEMRDLPEEQNREQKEAAFVDATGCGGPAEERRNRARNCADLKRPMRTLFERRVREDVEKIREHREERGRRIDEEREDRNREDRQRDAEPKREARRHATRGER